MQTFNIQVALEAIWGCHVSDLIAIFTMLFTATILAVFTVIARVVSTGEVCDALRTTPTATINAGQIIGTTTNIAGPTGSVAVNKFLGIPYATAPTGSLRFAPPQAPANWSSRDTKAFGNSCIQVFAPLSSRNFTEAVFNNPPPKDEDEDCLFVNVFAPKKTWDFNEPPYPVLYWMYGGAWKFGNAGLPWYDGSYFAALEDVIVVSVNYRINAFGLPISPSIANLTERNVALLDQRAGLQWVQDNIHHFGGNKSRVTIYGESAGGYAVGLLVTSYAPSAPRPFNAAIMESGVYAYLPYPNCNNNDYTAWNYLTSDLNCTGTDKEKFNCAQNERSAKQIKHAQELNRNISFAQACDNITAVLDPRLRVEAGNIADVPVIVGTNMQDGGVYTNRFGNDTDAYFNTYFPGMVILKYAVLAAYPLGSGGRTDQQMRLQQIQTDWNFHCPSVWYAETSSSHNPTYRYLFNASFANTQAKWPAWPTKYQGAYHSSEIPLVFTSYNGTNTTEPGQRHLSDTMRHAWANFAKNPNQAPIENWPKVGEGVDGKDVMGFGTDGKGESGAVVDAHNCEVWEALGFRELHL
ncbi:alpha/beta-hydrolase [Melanomma pulvis-pyrius CBS 109.77]|uniref:Carboxylic ester hydrolase n=1 Tax=Melanomma pulvis-pyrius CBS 109.77 TaxID=1314802 RepID=A0A6A6X3G4_9PLEO|nr:alpha/beta-hydrolase [Melanomma pulvis-pyrius CBS 109.77]